MAQNISLYFWILFWLLLPLTTAVSLSTEQSSDVDEAEATLARLRRAACSAGDCQNGGFCWPGPVTASTPPCVCPETHIPPYCVVANSNPVDYCAPGPGPPCKNGATCNRIAVSPFYSCSCVPGFTGYNCEINIDDCASRPCINGQCTDAVNSYSCSCYSGWEGSNCGTNHDDCFAGACLNRGRCVDGNKTYTCDCSGLGFSGSRCEVNIDDCVGNPCINGLCSDGVKDYSCSCYRGWEGKNCSADTNYCLPSPCQNGGLCSDGNSTYNCDCSRIDFKGVNCSSKIDDCPGNNCQNGGRCVDGDRSYTCDCTDTGFKGSFCEINIDDCAGNPCINGLCTDLVKDYRCSCYRGWEGKNCSVDTNYCVPSPCQNGGLCSDGNSTFSCNCSQIDFEGPTCSSKIDDCMPSLCQNGGRCIDGLRNYSCDCSSIDFSGRNCQSRIDDCSPNPCRNGAACVDELRNYTCSCYAGYSGKNCSIDTVDCKNDTCVNNGSCLERSNQALYGNPSLPPPFNGTFSYALAAGFLCACSQGWRSETCSVRDHCVPGAEDCPMRPGVQCVNLDPFGFECRTSAATFGSSSQSSLTTTKLSMSAMNLNESLTTVAGWARTRQSNCQLLSVSSGDGRQLTVDCSSSRLRVSLDNLTMLTSVSIATGLPFNFSVDCSVGTLLNLRVSFEGGDVITVSSELPVTTGLRLNSAAMVTIGGDSFKGCLNDIRLNGRLAPMVNRSLPTGASGFSWLSTDASEVSPDAAPLTSCYSDQVCMTKDSAGVPVSVCKNSGKCTDLWNDFRCDCSDGFSGRQCSVSDTAPLIGAIVGGFLGAVVVAVAIILAVKFTPACQPTQPSDPYLVPSETQGNPRVRAGHIRSKSVTPVPQDMFF